MVVIWAPVTKIVENQVDLTNMFAHLKSQPDRTPIVASTNVATSNIDSGISRAPVNWWPRVWA